MMISIREDKLFLQIKVQLKKVLLSYNPTMISKDKKQKMAQTISMILSRKKNLLWKKNKIGLIKESKIKKKKKKRMKTLR